MMVRKHRNDDWRIHLLRSCIVSDECWIWQKATRWGYGAVRYKARSIQAHRLMFMLTYPSIDLEGQQLNHRCDNRSCINPEHVYIGSQAQNVQDMIERGRWRNQHGGLKNEARRSCC